MQITPDFSEVVEQTPIPTGVYKARITEWKAKTSQKGNAYLNWKLQLFDCEGEASKYNGRILFHMTMLGGARGDDMKKFCKAALGEIPVDWAAFQEDELISREVEISVVPELQQDGTPSDWSKVKAVRPIQ